MPVTLSWAPNGAMRAKANSSTYLQLRVHMLSCRWRRRCRSSVVVGDVTYHFHILPSGLVNPFCKVNLIGSGCVVHLPSFFQGLEKLEAQGLTDLRGRLYIADRAHVCFDLHVVVDCIVEDMTKGVGGGRGMIGTTRKGIGSCYSDKVGRRGVTFAMLCSETSDWETRLRDLEKWYRRLYGDEALTGYDVDKEIKMMVEYRQVLRNFVVEATPLLKDAISQTMVPDGCGEWKSFQQRRPSVHTTS